MSTPSKDKYPENVVNPNFQKLLDSFHKIIDGAPAPAKVKEKLDALKQEAINTFLTGHQRDAIVARTNNYLSGYYASTSKEYKVHVHTK